MKRASSRRFSGAPMMSAVIGTSSSGRSGLGGGAGPHRGGGLADGSDDVLVAGAAADVALDGVPDRLIGGVRLAGEKVGGGHQHARRAEPALETVLLPEGLLERMEGARRGETFDGRNGRTVRLDGQHRAALDGQAVDQDRARAAT